MITDLPSENKIARYILTTGLMRITIMIEKALVKIRGLPPCF
jgi:hypothetical protein